MKKYIHILRLGLEGLMQSPRLLLVIAMLIVVPVLLVQVFSVFIGTALEHANTVERERIGMVHDMLGQILATSASGTLKQTVSYISEKNSDISSVLIGEDTAAGILVVAASEENKIGSGETKDERFTRALINPGTPIIYEYKHGSIRMWDTVSVHTDTASSSWYILTTQSHEVIDDLLAKREWYAYGLLMFTIFVCVAAGYWQLRNSDFEIKYTQEQQKTAEQSEITNMIAHELRSPLTAMRGYASMINEMPNLPASASSYAVRIEESTDRLIRIVNDFLDMARIQSGQLTIKPQSLNIDTIIDKVIEDLTPLATEKNLELTHTGEQKADQIMLDPTRLEQILTNLISNSIKYTKAGKVSVESQSHGQVLEIRIKDTGTGISAENQQKLFTPFFRVEHSENEGIVGTGLGMWITKRLIEAQGGTIGVESIKDIGTNMVLRFTLK